jgi:pilus assembly protein Flp/PilA
MFDRINHWTVALFARLQREEGQAMVEYALILALVSIAAIVTLKAVGVEVTSVLTDVKTALTGV